MIVTIDGPAGSGKSSAARLLAARLGWEVLDTGAMYRAIALAALRAGIAADDEIGLARILDGARLELPPSKVILNGEDVTTAIRSSEVTALASPVAAVPRVRRQLVAWQRALAAGRNLVTEGRDQGAVVFPDAFCKFFLLADPIERGRRRHGELTARGQTVELAEIVRAQEERDRRDAARDVAPMKPADDALTLDTTALTLDQVVDRMEAEVRRRMK